MTAERLKLKAWKMVVQKRIDVPEILLKPSNKIGIISSLLTRFRLHVPLNMLGLHQAITDYRE